MSDSTFMNHRLLLSPYRERILTSSLHALFIVHIVRVLFLGRVQDKASLPRSFVVVRKFIRCLWAVLLFIKTKEDMKHQVVLKSSFQIFAVPATNVDETRSHSDSRDTNIPA